MFLDSYPDFTREKSYLVVQNSLFQNGSNNVLDSSQKERYYKYANGLVLLLGQWEYTVQVRFENVTFTENTGNPQYMAILFYDYSTNNNNVYITNCTFTQEGTFVIYKRSTSEDYPTNQAPTNPLYYTIEKCTFHNGVDMPGIDILISGDWARRGHRQKIIISNCSFSQYNTRSEEVILQVIYKRNLQCCPDIVVRITDCIFKDNTLPCSKFLPSTFPYNENCRSCPSITLNRCTYIYNYSPQGSMVSVLSTTGDRLPIWNHEKYSKKSNHSTDQVLFANTLFINNTSELKSLQGIVYTHRVFISLRNCQFLNSIGTALRTNESVVKLEAENMFINNTGLEGGAMVLERSRMCLTTNSITTIARNKANYGGGIFATPYGIVADNNNPSAVLCTLSIPTYNLTLLKDMNITVRLVDNTALYAGDSIFYGIYDMCYVPIIADSEEEFTLVQENLLKAFTSSRSSKTDISSPMTQLCTCDGEDEKCNETTVHTYSGAKFNLTMRAIGELEHTPPVVVAGKICEDYHKNTLMPHICKHDYQNEIGYGEGKQIVTQNCSNVTYTIKSFQLNVTLEIKVNRLERETPSIDFESHAPYIMAKINLQPCPIGFELIDRNIERPFCECTKYLSDSGIVCDINQGKVLCPATKWIGFHYTHEGNITVNKNCPFDFCIAEDKYIDLSSPDEQCNFNRGGVLCGACRTNLSLVLGTSNCKECSNTYILLILPFAVAGLALIALLLKCNLTVSTGHINAIIFYANIVQVNKALLFPAQGITNAILSTFIAWLNLDLGIETCFFENLDAYAKVWLQFVFPVYVWILIALVIILSNYFSRAGRMIGNNSVPVLATLFILSYAKLLRTIIDSVSFSFVEFEDGTYVTVWHHDGNVEYFSPKHAALFFIALLFALGYILPLTFLVLFAPFLQARSHYKALHWVNRLKPFLDAYQGPYNDKFRYWTGLMLIVRIVLFIIFASNYEKDPSISFFCIIMVIGPIAIYSLSKRNQAVYKYNFANFLEVASLLNTVMLCAVNWLTTTTSYTKWHRIREYSTHVSVGIAMILFLSIIFYQILLKVCPQVFIKKKKQSDLQDDEPVVQEMSVPVVTSTVVELTESDRLKEPLLEP